MRVCWQDASQARDFIVYLFNMEFTSALIEKIKRLSRLNTDAEESEALKKQLPDILHFVEQLQSVDTHGVVPTHQVTGLSNVWRVDEIRACSADVQQKIIAQFPAREGNLLVTPAIFEDTSEGM